MCLIPYTLLKVIQLYLSICSNKRAYPFSSFGYLLCRLILGAVLSVKVNFLREQNHARTRPDPQLQL